MQNLIAQSLAELNRLKSIREFDFPCPICWFGNLKAGKPIILTLSINPSVDEFLPKKSRQYFRGMQGVTITPQNLEEAYNDYFNREPYTSWFDQQEALLNCKSNHASRAIVKHLTSITQVPLDASYYDDTLSNHDDSKKAKYQLVHVDLFPFATFPVWGKMEKTQLKPLLPGIFAFGMMLLEKIIDTYRPELIISFGGVPEKRTALKSYFGNEFTEDSKGLQRVPDVITDSEQKARRILEGSIHINERKIPIIFSTLIARDANRIHGVEQHVDYILNSAHGYLNGTKQPV